MLDRLPGRLALAARLLRAEGARSLLERWRERRSETARRRRFEVVALPQAAALLGAGETLNVLPFPLHSGLGGVAIALAARLARERTLRPTALLSHEPAGWRLEVVRQETMVAVELGGEGWSSLVQRPTASGLAVIRATAMALRSRVLHLESLAGVQLDGLAEIAGILAVVVSAHDFALFCRRPNLIEQPSGRFCGFSRDLERCLRCLAVDDPCASFAETDERRQAASRLLRNAAAVIHVSDFARRSHIDLFPELDPDLQQVIPPALEVEDPEPHRPPRWPPRHVAFVGQAADHKGLPDFVAASANVRARHPEVGWSVLGGGTPSGLATVRDSGIAVLGYFRPATLLRRLAEHRIDLAVLPSRFPETHSLVLDGCVQAGVPVLAASVGALGERVRELRAGWTFDAAQGASGLTEQLFKVLQGSVPLPTPEAELLPGQAEVALAHCALYERLVAR